MKVGSESGADDENKASAQQINTERIGDERRSTTLQPAHSSLQNTYRSNKDVLGADGATLVGITDIAIRSNSRIALQSQAKPTSGQTIDLARQTSHSNIGLYGGEYSNTRTVKTTTQWYLKSPVKNATFYD